MPNHVTSKLTISGPLEPIRQFADLVSGTVDGTESVFVLHRVIPQPAILSMVEDSSDSHFGLWLVDEELHKKLILDDPVNRMVNDLTKTPEANMPESFSRYTRCACGSREEAQAWARANRPKLFSLGEVMAKAYRECGYHSWYDWRIANWGTKWDAYNAILGQRYPNDALIYMFDTAWSPPHPVIEVLAEKFPALVMEHKFFDEASNFWGIHLYQDGVLTQSLENLEENYSELRIELLGYDQDEDEEES